MVVDDSALVRKSLSEILAADGHIEVIATAGNPFQAAEKIQNKVPDVIILDIEMPRMDGITFLKKIMTQHPIPTIICSSRAKGSWAAKAMEYGAIEFIQKPKMGTRQFFEESQILICDAVKSAASAMIRKYLPSLEVPTKLSADAILPKRGFQTANSTENKVVAVAASTGGVEAILCLLKNLHPEVPGIVIVQHMPEHFTTGFANRLNSLCKIKVKEAEQNDPVVRGTALISPGNMHILLQRSGSKYYVDLRDGPLVSRHRPSGDVLFRSTARYAGKNALGIIMTGMGDDGAKGLKEMSEAGARTIAQDEKSSIVFGMPKKAIELGAVDVVLPLQKIAYEILDLARTLHR